MALPPSLNQRRRGLQSLRFRKVQMNEASRRCKRNEYLCNNDFSWPALFLKTQNYTQGGVDPFDPSDGHAWRLPRATNRGHLTVTEGIQTFE